MTKDDRAKAVAGFDAWMRRAGHLVTISAAAAAVWGFVTGYLPRMVVAATEAAETLVAIQDAGMVEGWSGMRRSLKAMQAELEPVPDTLVRMDLRLSAIEDRTVALEGSDRVIRQPELHSYVEEPVHQGNPVVWHLFLGRTELGLPCEYIGGTSLFTGERRITFRGPHMPVIQQVGREVEELRIEIMPPSELRPARIALEAQLTYRCPIENGGTKTVLERTKPTFFLLLPAP